jgi:hypothetical protein
MITSLDFFLIFSVSLIKAYLEDSKAIELNLFFSRSMAFERSFKETPMPEFERNHWRP